MSLKSLCVLNCIEDAQLFLEEFSGEYDEWLTVSTHGSVNDFLKTKKLQCLELSSLMTHEFIQESYWEADAVVKKLLSNLDQRFAKEISSILGFNEMNYFMPFYLYLGKYEYASALRLKKALDIVINQNDFKDVVVYQSVSQKWHGDECLVTEIVRQLSLKYHFSQSQRVNRIKHNKYFHRILAINRQTLRFEVKNILQKAIKKIKERFLSIRIDPRKKTVLLLGHLYELEFLKKELKDSYSVVYWPFEGMPRIVGMSQGVNDEIFVQISSILATPKSEEKDYDGDPIYGFFSKSYLDHFQNNLKKNIPPLILLDNLYKKSGIDLYIWGNAPNSFCRSLITEYLLRTGLPVVGMQHGSLGAQRIWSDLDGEFSLCTHFLSYGFDEHDLQDLYPGRPIPCKFIPVGSYKEFKKQKKRKNRTKDRIDILFPMHNSTSITHGGLRISAILSEYRTKIIETLEQLVNQKIIIKPSPVFSHHNCSIWEVIKSLQHVKILRGIAFPECFEQYDVRATVMEYSSTPLFEAIGEDVEIILMEDKEKPFDKQALTLLKKRVHYFQHIEDLQDALVEYTKGNLPRLRNDEFYHKYVYRENTKEQILKNLENLL